MALKIVDGKFIVGTGKNAMEFTDPTAALAHLARLDSERKDREELGYSVSVTDKGLFQVSYTDVPRLGRFPAFKMTGRQFKLIYKAWPEIVQAFNEAASNGEISEHWEGSEKSAPINVPDRQPATVQQPAPVEQAVAAGKGRK